MKVNQSYCKYCKKELSHPDDNDFHQSCFDEIEDYDVLYYPTEWYGADKVYSHELEFFKSLIPYCKGWEDDEENYEWKTSNRIHIKKLHITHLDIYFKEDVDEIPPEFFNVTSLKKLKWLLIEFRGRDLPDSLFSFPNLKILILKIPLATILPNEIFELKDLKNLSLRIPNVFSIPNLFSKLPHLENLNFSEFNGVIPDSIYQLKRLKSISFPQFDYTNIHSSRIVVNTSKMINFIKSLLDLEKIYLHSISLLIDLTNGEDINFFLRYYELLTKYCEEIGFVRVFKQTIIDLEIHLKETVVQLPDKLINTPSLKRIILRFDGENIPSPFFSLGKIKTVDLTIPNLKIIPEYFFSEFSNIQITFFKGSLPELLYHDFQISNLTFNNCFFDKFLFPDQIIVISRFKSLIFNNCSFQDSEEELDLFLKKARLDNKILLNDCSFK
ncbi:MAG: hypothetical protein HeimC3_12830 [Candidatus Heimdallarchaeota archaeon LC_3]|nr:MAG: hypothetical protein HeimC3_12830 [Candidatus Heimdallarchaeota archaeon LC_3]